MKLKKKDEPDEFLGYLENLSIILEEAERYDEAFKNYFLLLKYKIKICGESNEDIGEIYFTLAELSKITNQFKKASKFYRKSLVVFENIYGDSDYDVLTMLQNYTVFLRNHKFYDDAEKYYALLLERRERANGLIHSGTGSSWFSYAKFQNTKGDLTKAEKACRKALDIRTQLEEPDYEDIGNTQLLLAQILLNKNQKKEALKMAKAARKSYKKTEDEDLVAEAEEIIEQIQSQ